MPGRRSAAKVAERHLATNVRERERSVAAREVRVGRRETTAPKVNEFEVRLAKEAATTATMATNLAAHHLVEDVGAHSDELLAAPKMVRRPVPVPAAPLPFAYLWSVCDSARRGPAPRAGLRLRAPRRRAA